MVISDIIDQRLSQSPVPLSEKGLPREPVRLLHGRGQEDPEFDKINIDYYPPLLIVSLYKSISNKEIAQIERQLSEQFPESPLLIQNRSIRPFTTFLVKGDVPDEMIIQEGGLQFYLHPLRGQNPGFFTDMREGRRKINQIIKKIPHETKIKVLNLFAYTCSLSVTALAAGADRVINIDMNKKSLNIGRRNHLLNHKHIKGGYTNQALFLGHNIYKSFGRLKREGPYDLIIADPPPSQKGSFDVNKDYPRLLKRLPDMLKQTGELLLTLNGPDKDWEDFEEMISKSIPGDYKLERVREPQDFAPLEEGRGLKLIRVFR